MATHTLNFPGANLNATESTVDTATIGTGGLIVDTNIGSQCLYKPGWYW